MGNGQTEIMKMVTTTKSQLPAKCAFCVGRCTGSNEARKQMLSVAKHSRKVEGRECGACHFNWGWGALKNNPPFCSFSLWNCPWLLFCLCLHRDHSGLCNHGDRRRWEQMGTLLPEFKHLFIGDVCGERGRGDRKLHRREKLQF